MSDFTTTRRALETHLKGKTQWGIQLPPELLEVLQADVLLGFTGPERETLQGLIDALQ